MVEERGEPGADGGIVERTIGEMSRSRLRVRQLHALVTARGPATDGGVRHVGMKLQRIAGAVAERLHREAVALRQEVRAVRQIEPLAMPLIDLLRPGIAQ